MLLFWCSCLHIVMMLMINWCSVDFCDCCFVTCRWTALVSVGVLWSCGSKSDVTAVGLCIVKMCWSNVGCALPDKHMQIFWWMALPGKLGLYARPLFTSKSNQTHIFYFHKSQHFSRATGSLLAAACERGYSGLWLLCMWEHVFQIHTRNTILSEV